MMAYHRNRPKRAFTRHTFSDLQTTVGNTVTESGLPLDTDGNAGPHLYDYSHLAHPNNLGIGSDEYIITLPDYTMGTTSGQGSAANSREFTWDLIDGINMGPDKASEYVGANGLGNLNFGATSWETAEYVVIRDLAWELELLPPRPQNCLIYQASVDDDDNDDDLDDLVHFPRTTILGGANTLTDLLDGYSSYPEEVGDANDVWSELLQVLRAPVMVTLMRLPLMQGSAEAISDMALWNNTNQQIPDPDSNVMFAPLGYMRYKELDEPALETENWSVTNDLLGCTRANQGSQFYDRVYRPWQNYDNMRGVFLHRQLYKPKYWVSAHRAVQQHAAVDPGEDDLVAPQGHPAHPTNVIARNLIIRGSFKGEIVVSRKDPRPLVLTMASCPIKLASPDFAGGTRIDLFARHTMSLCRWRVTGTIKTR